MNEAAIVNYECPVCQCDVTDAIATVQGCNHRFCIPCIITSILMTLLCPIDNFLIAGIIVRRNDGVEYLLSANHIRHDYMVKLEQEGQQFVNETIPVFIEHVHKLSEVIDFLSQTDKSIDQIMSIKTKIYSKICKWECLYKTLQKDLSMLRNNVSKELLIFIQQFRRAQQCSDQMWSIHTKFKEYIMHVNNVSIADDAEMLDNAYATYLGLAHLALMIFNLWLHVKSSMKNGVKLFRNLHPLTRFGKNWSTYGSALESICQIMNQYDMWDNFRIKLMRAKNTLMANMFLNG